MRVMQAAQRFDDDVAHNMRTIAKLRPRIVGMTEMANGPQDDTKLAAARQILGPAGYTICTADDGGAHCHELVTAIRLGPNEVLEAVTVTQLSPDLGAGIANDRHLLVVRTHNRETKRRRAHAQTHWNAGLQGPHGNVLNVDRVKVTAKGSEIMEGILRGLLTDGDLTVAGDFNWRLHDNDPRFHGWTHSPPAMFDRLGMAYDTTGLDWLAYSDGLHSVGDLVVLQPGHDGNGSDHPWMIRTLWEKATR